MEAYPILNSACSGYLNRKKARKNYADKTSSALCTFDGG